MYRYLIQPISMYDWLSFIGDCIGGIKVRVLASSVVDSRIETQSGQTNDYKIGICCFSAKHAALRSRSNDWLTRNQDDVFEWKHISIFRLLFLWANTTRIQLLVCWSSTKRTLSSSHWSIICSYHNIVVAEKLLNIGVRQQSLLPL